MVWTPTTDAATNLFEKVVNESSHLFLVRYVFAFCIVVVVLWLGPEAEANVELLQLVAEIVLFMNVEA